MRAGGAGGALAAFVVILRLPLLDELAASLRLAEDRKGELRQVDAVSAAK